MLHKINFFAVLFLLGLFLIACKNPFAPKLDENIDGSGPPISDQTTIEGLFQNFQYAYSFKDTLIYGSLISQDFTFTYRDYEQGYDVNWGRDEEIRTTNGLFLTSQRVDLIRYNISNKKNCTILNHNLKY